MANFLLISIYVLDNNVHNFTVQSTCPPGLHKYNYADIPK